MTAPLSLPRSAAPAARDRPTGWWLGALERRATRMHAERLDLGEPITFLDETERRAAIKFFNAAFRAEESGLRQAHELGAELESLDPELARTLRLYGDEEGWHRQLLTEFLSFLGGQVEPMGRVTRLLYRLYGRAQRMETIVLANLMFETIGSTTYRLALRHVRHRSARQMLTILTRDESFHVPLNVHFLRRVLETRPPRTRRRLQRIHTLLFCGLLLLPLFSRPKAQAFDGISRLSLMRAYAKMLAGLFAREPDLGFSPPRLVLWGLGLSRDDLADGEVSSTSVEAAERSMDRDQVSVSAL